MLTASQQDYLEVVFRLENERGSAGVRVKDIADELGTRMPTVTRTVRRIAHKGYLAHSPGGRVRLTEKGQKLAGEILHLHTDLILFLTEVLGLDAETARRDACQIEHSCSAQTAQRLHEFLEYYQKLPGEKQRVIADFTSQKTASDSKFKYLTGNKVHGWRT